MKLPPNGGLEICVLLYTAVYGTNAKVCDSV